MLENNHYELLIAEFEKFPKPSLEQPTLFEIAGFPNYENVASNVLRFFLDTEECHGLGGLFLNTLLQCLKDSNLSEYINKTFSVNREVTTEKGNRIDIVVECADLNVAIENKIFHILNNDLEDYRHHISQKYMANSIVIVLSIRQENIDSYGAGFYAITYKRFFNRLLKNIGQYILNSNNQYITFLLDFIKTINNLNNPVTMTDQTLTFFDKHYKSIESLHREYMRAMNMLTKMLNAIAEAEKFPESKLSKKWVWEGYILAHEFPKKDDRQIVVDFSLNFTSYEIQIKDRISQNNGFSTTYIKSLLGQSTPSITIIKETNSGVIVKERDVRFDSLDFNQVAMELDEILEYISSVL